MGDPRRDPERSDANVSRETTPLSFGGEAPEPPDSAADAFGERLSLVRRYADHLAHAGVERGLIGPREADRLWDRHLLNGAALAAAIPEGSTVADIGSGAGLPGIPLALARPDLRITLIEPLLRRTTFLDEVVADLGLADQVEVVRGRADALHGERSFDIVTARAVAPLTRLLGWAVPLLSPTGELIALKGESAEQELADATRELAQWSAGEVEVLDLRAAGTSIRAVRVGPPTTADGVRGWPRRRTAIAASKRSKQPASTRRRKRPR